MGRIPTNCPTCNSTQTFAPHKRVEGDMVYTYIRCNMCKSEFTIALRSAEQERAYLRVRNQRIGATRRSRRSR